MRKFGVEIELNSFDQRDFKKNPLGKNEYPLGIDYVAELIKKINSNVRIENWQNTHNNSDWVCKSDSSCGMEICSPVFDNLDELLKLIDALSKDHNIKVDDRCSFHVHFDVSDCVSKNLYKSESLASILAWWIKCEPIFYDSIPDHRKLNRYCQFIGISEIFKIEDPVDPEFIIRNLSTNKYFSINVFHLCKLKRSSIEFRTADFSACLDSNFAKNWIKFLSHFIDCAIRSGLPENFSWIDPKHFFDFLGFEKDLSLEKKEFFIWFLNSIKSNIKSDVSYMDFSMRKLAFLEFEEILKKLQLDKEFSGYSISMDK